MNSPRRNDTSLLQPAITWRRLFLWTGAASFVCCGLLFFSFARKQETDAVAPDAKQTKELLTVAQTVPTKERDETSVASAEPGVPSEELHRIDKAVAQARAKCQLLEQRNAAVLQHLLKQSGDETVVILIHQPSEKDYEDYADCLSSMIKAYQGTPAGQDALRAEATALLQEFTEYPMSFKVLHLAMSKDGKFVSFTERFANDEQKARIDEATSTFTSMSGDRSRDDDWNAENSWARKRYNYLFEQ